MLMLVLGSKCSSQKEALCILYNPNKTKLLFVKSSGAFDILPIYPDKPSIVMGNGFEIAASLHE